MRPLFLLLLCACGPTPFLQPVQSDALVQGPNAPVDCVALCQRVKTQLVRDFGVPADQLDCSAATYVAARDCASCQNVFRMGYGVELTDCR